MCYRFGIERGRIELGGISKKYLDLSATVELQYDEVEYCAHEMMGQNYARAKGIGVI